MPKIANIMSNKSIKQQAPNKEIPLVSREIKPINQSLADLIRSINEANKPKVKIESSWQPEPEPPLAA